MGNTESNQEDFHEFDGCETLGYRVLGVQPNSPAARAGLVSFFDFLVGANGQLLFGINAQEEASRSTKNNDTDDEYFEDVDFPALLKGNVNQEIELLVWNIKSQTQRFITLTPSTEWGGQGLLGVTIRMDNFAAAEDNLLRVLSVQKSSPAQIAGLTPNSDYLLGTAMESFSSEDMLAAILEENTDRVVEIYVYNTESDVVRVVTLMPTLSWGGGGLLGAEVGRGYLHRLPKSCRSTLGVSFERKVRVSARGGAQDHVVATGTSSIDTDHIIQRKKDSSELASLEKEENSSPEVICGDTGVKMEIEPQMEFESPPFEKEFDEDSPIQSNLPTFTQLPAPPRLDNLVIEDPHLETGDDKVGSPIESNDGKIDEVSADELPPPPISHASDNLESSCETIDLR